MDSTELINQVQKKDSQMKLFIRASTIFLVFFVITSLGYIAYNSHQNDVQLKNLQAQNAAQIAENKIHISKIEAENNYITCLLGQHFGSGDTTVCNNLVKAGE